MVEIDGSHGEGGGQLVRNAVALAAVGGVPVRIVRVRARRPRPGLAAQHAAAVRAVAALCDARCDGVQPGSTELSFEPRKLHGGVFEIDVGTAGSVALVVQALLPAAVACGERTVAAIRGGTDVRAAPPVDYLKLVLLPLLSRMGVRAELEVDRRGYYPKGGGAVRLTVEPVARLAPLALYARGPVERVEVRAHVSRLPRSIAERMAAAARAMLPPGVESETAIEVYGPADSAGPGGALVLRASAGATLLGAAAVAERGVPAERLGHDAARMLRADLDAGATLDLHATDQMLPFLALATAPSSFRAAQLSSHAATGIWLLERLTRARFRVESGAPGVTVHVQPS